MFVYATLANTSRWPFGQVNHPTDAGSCREAGGDAPVLGLERAGGRDLGVHGLLVGRLRVLSATGDAGEHGRLAKIGPHYVEAHGRAHSATHRARTTSMTPMRRCVHDVGERNAVHHSPSSIAVPGSMAILSWPRTSAGSLRSALSLKQTHGGRLVARVAKAATQVDVRGQRLERLWTTGFEISALPGALTSVERLDLMAEDQPGLEAVAQALRLGQRCERLQRGVFDLPDPLAGDAEGAPHLVECSRMTAV
jgi:hypothetical protein